MLMDDEYAVILLDVNMPGMDGFETASLIHQHPRFEKTPIIFVTAVNVSDLDRMRGYKLGAVDYVMVPVIPEILRSKVVVLAELYPQAPRTAAGQRAPRGRERSAAHREGARTGQAQRVAAAGERELAARNVELQTRSPSACAPSSSCSKPTGARTNSSRRSRTNCAIRWRRCATRCNVRRLTDADAAIRCRT